MFKRVIVGSVLAAGLVAAAPAGAATSPTAQASGGDVPPPLPSLVQTRLTRVENALERLTEDVDEVNGVHALVTAKVVRRQLGAAWRGARYYITHAPPPPADDARVQSARDGVRVRDLTPKVRAKITQDEDDAVVIADPVTTAMAVFNEFHNVASTGIELTDGARVPVLDAINKTVFLTLDRRDSAINDVRTLAPPPPPEAEDASVRAKAAQDDDALTFDVTMPGLTLFLDDEIQHIDGLTSDATDLRPGGSRLLSKARAQITMTKFQIWTIWPPVIDD